MRISTEKSAADFKTQNEIAKWKVQLEKTTKNWQWEKHFDEIFITIKFT